MPASAVDLKVDIVINNYNYGRYLAEAIDSACAQTHENVGVIVVDDGSTDESRELVQGYRDRVTLVLKENGGQASAFNAGIEHSDGDIVMFLDADDTLLPEAAARVAARFAVETEVAKVQIRMQVTDAESRPTGEIKPLPHAPMPNGDFRHDELAFPFDLAWLPTSGNAFRAEALRRILPVPEDQFPVCGADWYVIHLGTLLGTVASLDEVLATYRVHGANNYELASDDLNLAHVRETIGYAQTTAAALLALAARLRLPHPKRILSIADLANRIVSLRLEPNLHPVADDSLGGLVADAVRATRRRTNVSPAMRIAFVGWFAAVAISPRPLARQLAIYFLFPQRRQALNRLLGRLHRGDDQEATKGNM